MADEADDAGKKATGTALILWSPPPPPRLTHDQRFENICADIVGGMSLRQALTVNGNMSFGGFYKLVDTSELRREQYARALSRRNETRFEELIDIADSAMPEPGSVARARLRWDARRWNLAKSQPKKYGEKVEHDLTGGGQIESVGIRIKFVSPRIRQEDDDA